MRGGHIAQGHMRAGNEMRKDGESTFAGEYIVGVRKDLGEVDKLNVFQMRLVRIRLSSST